MVTVERAHLRKTSLWSVPLFLIVYGGFLLLNISRLSLWLDELIEITKISQLDFAFILKNMPSNPGGAPLGYFIEAIPLHFIGVSAFSARLPSLVFGVASCFVVYLLAREFNLRYPAAAVALFALLPMQVRYSLEGRPYAEGLFFSALATLLLLKYLEQPRRAWIVLLFSTAVLALYSQPYSFLPVAAQILALFTDRSLRKNRSLWKAALALAASLLLFLPWLLYTHDQWKAGIDATVPSSGISLKTPVVIFKDLLGSGYVGSIAVAISLLFGLRSRAALTPPAPKTFIVFSVLIPIFVVICADAATGYFFAIRQIYFVLPGIAIRAALGFEDLWDTHNRAIGWVLLAAVIGIQIGGILNWFNRPREDWKGAAIALTTARPRYDCIVFVPSEIREYFGVFDPALAASACSSSQLTGASAIALAACGATSPRLLRDTLAKVSSYNLRRRSVVLAGDPAIEILARQ